MPQVGIINPGEFAPGNSIEVVIWTAVGGRGTLIGPILGAILVNGGKTIFTAAWPNSGSLPSARSSSPSRSSCPRDRRTVAEFMASAKRRRKRQKSPLKPRGAEQAEAAQ